MAGVARDRGPAVRVKVVWEADADGRRRAVEMLAGAYVSAWLRAAAGGRDAGRAQPEPAP